MTDAERLEIITAAIAEARPALQRDGGDIALVAVGGDRVKVSLKGARMGCALAGQTLGGIRRRLMQVLDTPVMVVPVAG
ncbi:MAG: NifU family protein [Magnetospirillum sp.]|nr:NifU family protein [Magnetospirillum sp.]